MAKFVPLSCDAVIAPSPVPELQIVVPATTDVRTAQEPPSQYSRTDAAVTDRSVKQASTGLLPDMPLLTKTS